MKNRIEKLELYIELEKMEREINNQVIEEEMLLNNIKKKFKHIIKIVATIGFALIFSGFNINLIYKICLVYDYFEIINSIIITALVFLGFITILSFIKTRFAINIGASSLSPFFAILLLFIQDSTVSSIELVNALALPLLITMITYGILVLFVNIIFETIDWIVNKIAKFTLKDTLQRISKLKLHQTKQANLLKIISVNTEESVTDIPNIVESDDNIEPNKEIENIQGT